MKTFIIFQFLSRCVAFSDGFLGCSLVRLARIILGKEYSNICT